MSAGRIAAIIVTAPIWIFGLVLVSPLLFIYGVVLLFKSLMNYAATGEWEWLD